MAAYKLVAVHDSNGAGGYPSTPTLWPTLLAAQVQAALPSDTITMQNNSVGGDTTYEHQTNFATRVGDESPTVVIFIVDTNDTYYDTPSGSGGGAPRGDGVDYSETGMAARVADMVADSQLLFDAAGRQTRVIVCSAPVAARLSDGMSTYRDHVRLAAGAAELEAVASAAGVPFVDLQTDMLANVGWLADYIQGTPGPNDGVHLKAAGQQFIADALEPVVLAMIEGASLTLNADDDWEQSGSAITVTATGGVRSSVTATVTSARGGAIGFRGDDASYFSVSSDGTSWSSTLSISPGVTSIYLSVVAPSGPTTLSAEVGVPE